MVISGTPAPLPKIVHFTRPEQPRKLGVGPFPVLIWEVALRSWQRHFPVYGGYTHRVWRDQNLTECMRQEFPEFLDGFLALPGGIERSDIGRYCALYQQGGIYADLDYEVRTNFYAELPADLVSLVECRSKDPGLEVENALMASPPRHEFWRLAMQQCFHVAGRHRWDDARGGTGPRLLSTMLRDTIVNEMVHVLPCQLFQRGIQGDGAIGSCGHVADESAQGQRGIHWSTTSHTAFVGSALRAEVFYTLHPGLQGRPFFRETSVHEVAARSAGALTVERPPNEAAPLLAACLRGAGLESAASAVDKYGPLAFEAESQSSRQPCPDGKRSAMPRAELLLRNALLLRPTASDLLYLLGSALQAQGRLMESLIQYCKAVTYDSEMAGSVEATPSSFMALGKVALAAQTAAKEAGLGDVAPAESVASDGEQGAQVEQQWQR
ncbi:CSH1 [Symbiodinium sp. CCMP2592]|nr:CSH1 [Symbiodinium sp. CCMP2592]